MNNSFKDYDITSDSNVNCIYTQLVQNGEGRCLRRSLSGIEEKTISEYKNETNVRSNDLEYFLKFGLIFFQ